MSAETPSASSTSARPGAVASAPSSAARQIAEIGRRFPLALAPINPADEMYRVTLRRFPDPEDARLAYLRTGERIAESFRAILRMAEIDPEAVGTFLDFAGGYGRNMRFIKPGLPNAACALSDIDRRAVDVAAAELGVEGLYSALSPDDLDWSRRFDLVLAVSLFTHLKPPIFNAWLTRLVAMTDRDGALVVTTHPISKPRGALDWTEIAPKEFYFTRLSEAEGRLDLDYYGGSIVGVDWMRRTIAEAGGQLICMLPQRIGDHDVYVIRPA